MFTSRRTRACAATAALSVMVLSGCAGSTESASSLSGSSPTGIESGIATASGPSEASGGSAAALTSAVTTPRTRPTAASPASCVKQVVSSQTTRDPVSHLSRTIQTEQRQVAAMGIDSDAGTLYAVPSAGPVVLVDTRTGQVTGRVDRPTPHETWSTYLTVDPAAGTAYLLANRPSLLSEIDVASGQIVRHVEPDGVEPSGMAADLSGGVLYVTNVPSSLDAPVSVSVLNASTLGSIGSIDLGVTDPPSSLIFDPVTCQLVTSGVNSAKDTEILLVDPVTGSSRSLFSGANGGGAGIDSANGIVYQFGIDGLWSIDIATGTRTMVTTELVGEVAADPAAGVVYAAAVRGGDTSTLLVIDGKSRAVVSTIPLDFKAGLVEVDEATGDVYITDGGDGGQGSIAGPIRVFSS